MAESTAAPTVGLSEALLVRRTGDGGARSFDFRSTLESVRDGVRQVTDAAALRELLQGVAASQQPAAPDKDEVSTLQRVVEMGKTLTGTPSDREKSLKDELDTERKNRRALEGLVFDMREEMHKMRSSSKADERDAAVAMAEVFQRMMDTFMKYSDNGKKPADDDPLRQIGASVLQGFVTQKPTDRLQEIKDLMGAMRELGLAPGPQQQTYQDPDLLRVVLEHQLGIHKVDKETEATISAAQHSTDRFTKLAPVLGVLGTAALSRLAGEDVAQSAASEIRRLQGDEGEEDEGGRPPAQGRQTASRPRPDVRPVLYRCEGCGGEIALRGQAQGAFPCPYCGEPIGDGAPPA